MGDLHAVEWIAIIPVERARRFRVRPADRELGKARGPRGGARRSQRPIASVSRVRMSSSFRDNTVETNFMLQLYAKVDRE